MIPVGGGVSSAHAVAEVIALERWRRRLRAPAVDRHGVAESEPAVERVGPIAARGAVDRDPVDAHDAEPRVIRQLFREARDGIGIGRLHARDSVGHDLEGADGQSRDATGHAPAAANRQPT